MTYISSDQGNIAHIATQNDSGFWTSACGVSVGAPEYETETEARRVGMLLTLTERGCLRCARIVIPPTKKELKAS